MNTHAPQSFADLEIHISAQQDAGYPVRMRLDMQQEFPPGYLSTDILPWISGGDPMADGQRLLDLLLADQESRSAWLLVCGQAPRHRIRLRIDEDAPELHALPWELLHERDVWLAAQTETPFSRYLPCKKPWGVPVSARPLRILVAISSPDDLDQRNLAPLDVAQERTTLEQALLEQNAQASKLLNLTFLEPPVTLERLETALRQSVHVWHYIGHGAFSHHRDEAALYLQDEIGHTHVVADQDLVAMMSGLSKPPRMVFLAACESATRSTTDAFLGLAPQLVRETGMPAVVAMQDTVAITTARKLGTVFYQRLATHGVIDLALNEARRTLLTAGRPDAAVPVLFMRLQDGRLFDVPTSKRRVPFVLPQLDTPVFTGRDEELVQLETLLLGRKGPKVCSIVGLAGTGGIGKSALACHFAESHRADFPDGVIGLRVSGKDADTIAREFARCVGAEIDPEDTRGAVTIMQETFAHRRTLLIFDNAMDATVRDLRPGGERCAVIITTRDRDLPALLDVPVEGLLDVQPLPDTDSLDLLERLLGKDRVNEEYKAACEIIGQVGNLPLALQIVGATLRAQPERSLANYVRSLSLAKLHIRGDKDRDVRASFALSLELLEPEEIDFFACTSVCAEDGFSIQAAMAAGDCDEDTAYERLSYLYRLSLLNRPQSGTGRFVLHTLIRQFAQELADERGLQAAAAGRHARFFIQLVTSSDVNDRAAASVLAEEMESILLAAEWLQHHGVADYAFVLSLEPFFERYGHWEHAVSLMERFRALAERIEDWASFVQLCIQQAKYLSRRGDFAQAEEVLTPIADVANKIESQFTRQRSEAMWRNTLGVILRDQGRFDEAVDAFQRSYDILESLEDERGQAMVLNSLGGVYQRQGRFDEAVDAFQRSVQIGEDLGDQRSLAMVLNSLGGVYQRQGRFDEAVDAFQRSYDISEGLGDQRSLAMVLNSLGGALSRTRQFEEAAAAFQRSIAIEESLGNQRGIAMALNSLGRVLQRQKKVDEAVKALQRSGGIEEKLGNRRGQSMVLVSLGEVFGKQGLRDKAITTIQQALDIAKDLGDQRGQAIAHTALGKTLYFGEDLEKAVTELVQGFEVDEGLENQWGMGIVTPVLADALLKLGRREEAQAYCQRALVIAPRNERLLQLQARLAALEHVDDQVTCKVGVVKRILVHRDHGYRYGFIAPEDGSPDIYFREGPIAPEAFAQLAEGTRVEVQVEPLPWGVHTRHIKIIG